jgi:hypothetical protein
MTKTVTIPNVNEKVEHLKLSYIAGRNVKWYHELGSFLRETYSWTLWLFNKGRLGGPCFQASLSKKKFIRPHLNQ